MAVTDLIRGRQVVVTLTNSSGGSVAAGDVVIFNTGANDSFTTTTSANSTSGVGIVQETIANGATGRVLVAGYAPLVNVNASVTRGRFLFTHTVAKQAAESATYGAGAFGVVLTAGTSPTAQIFGATGQASSGGAPADAEYWVETANGTLSNEVVVGTTGITTAAYASRQAAAKAGRLFLPSNGFYLERDTGAAWAPWGPIFPFTVPVDGDFSWINQGSASVSTTNGGIHLLSGGSGKLQLRIKSAPATPYTLTVCFLPHLARNAGVFNSCGIGFRQSSDGKLAVVALVSQATALPVLDVQKWTSATVFSAAYTASWLPLSNPQGPTWIRIADDGANRICSASGDGQNFITMHSVGRTDFLTADQLCFFVNDDSNADQNAMTLLSWKQA